jgi:hypothetical protein
VGNLAKDDRAFSGAANSYLNNPASKETPPKQIIWEIPEPDLQSAYIAPHYLSLVAVSQSHPAEDKLRQLARVFRAFPLDYYHHRNSVSPFW